MGELTRDIPKPLLPVAGIPLIYYALFFAYKLGVTDVVINLHYKKERILEELKNFRLMNIHFSVEEPEILGTAGGIKTATEGLWSEEEIFLVINPDVIFLPEKEFHPLKPGYAGEALLYLLPNIGDEDYTVLDLQNEKVLFQNGKFYFCGISVLKRSILKNVSVGTYSDLSDKFKELSRNGMLDGKIFPGRVVDFGDIGKYLMNKDVQVFHGSDYLEFEKFYAGRAGN